MSWTRRSFLFSLAALAACARAKPLAVLPERHQRSLDTFLSLVAGHRVAELLPFFDAEHLAFQRKLWFSDDYNDEEPVDPDDPREVAAFHEQYVIEVLGLGYVDNHVDSLSQVRRVEVVGTEEPFGADGPLKVLLAIETGIGPRTGWFFFDRERGRVFGASG